MYLGPAYGVLVNSKENIWRQITCSSGAGLAWISRDCPSNLVVNNAAHGDIAPT